MCLVRQLSSTCFRYTPKNMRTEFPFNWLWYQTKKTLEAEVDLYPSADVCSFLLLKTISIIPNE